MAHLNLASKAVRSERAWTEMRALVVGGYGFYVCDETLTITWHTKRFVAPNVLHLQRFIRGRCYMNFCQARELCAAWTTLETFSI